MMRRIDARISSIEGSWTFAGCVISDSTSKAFYTKPQRICRFRICRPGFSSHRPDLSPDQARPMHRARSRSPFGTRASPPRTQTRGANRSVAYGKGMSRQDLIASNALMAFSSEACPARDAGSIRLASQSNPRRLRGLNRRWKTRQKRPGRSRRRMSSRAGRRWCRDQRPSGVRTPIQLSRT
jgi:hypothetical protein